MTLMCLPFTKSKGNYNVSKGIETNKISGNSAYHSSLPRPNGNAQPPAPQPTPPQPTPPPEQDPAQEGPRAAVFGGRISDARNAAEIIAPRYSKDDTSRRLIKNAIINNEFLKNLDRQQVDAVVDSMVLRHVEGNSFLITEGDIGSHMYVAAEGKFDVYKDGQRLGSIDTGQVFGELALLYNATRQASIKVLTKSKVWELERKVFQQIMMRTGLEQRDDKIRFLRSVPILKELKNNDIALTKIADLLKVEFFPSDECIIREGDEGNTFYIISGGSVKINKKKPGSKDEEEIGTLNRGEFFGERAILSNEKRAATITALSPGVECLVLDREAFLLFLGPLPDLKNVNWNNEGRVSIGYEDRIEFPEVQLKDLELVATLGVGGFGRVELVTHHQNRNKTFALKCLKKVHVVQQQQEQHVFNEKKVMLECKDCPFVIRLYRTYRDNKYVYFLMEPCLGGDLFTLLQKRRFFSEQVSRFMTACVIGAFKYLHDRNIVYRDLKPENVMLDQKGYLKVIDFGFAKKIPPSSKTWTFAGTPEYVAPEIILGKGHDRAADCWTLGIFMYELLVGKAPFRGTDHMRTYNLILKGIETVHFPKHVSKHGSRLIKRLCRAVPTERIGYQRNGINDIKDDPWFHGFKWDALEKGTMKSPIDVQISGPKDIRHFDKYPKSKDIPPDELSGWDKDF